ncbi:MAG: MarR family transcriptional regulator [Candidatus Omnitrophota bacterium]
MSQRELVEFADKVSQIMPVLLRSFAKHQANELYKGKITFPQFLVLDCLYREKQARMNSLAAFMHVSTAAMTGLVERLVRDGYCVRRYEPSDRRIINIRLSEKGEAMVMRINEQRRRMVIDIFGQISLKDREEYLMILQQVKDILVKKGQ